MKNELNVVLYLARQELCLSFRTLFAKAYPGGRDLFWLTGLMTLIFTCALLVLGIKQGLTDRFVDVLLGSVPNAGIPVWIQTDLNSGKMVIDEGMTALVAERVRKMKYSAEELSIHPYNDVGINDIAIPNQESVWTEKDIRFKGIAVYENDPLWRYAIDTEATLGQNAAQDADSDNAVKVTAESQLKIVLDRSLFVKYFNYEKYRQYLSETEKLPEVLMRKVPANKEGFLRLTHPILWLYFGVSKDLLPVSVAWTQHLPILGSQAFLVSAEFFHVFKFASFNNNIRYFPEGVDRDNWKKVVTRGKRLSLPGTMAADKRGKLQDCLLRVKVEAGSGFYYMTLERPMPDLRLQGCIEHAGLANGDYTIEDFETSNAIHETMGMIDIPCEEWPEELWTIEERHKCNDNRQNEQKIRKELPVIEMACKDYPESLLRIDEKKLCEKNMSFQRRMTKEVMDYVYAFLYVQRRTQLDAAIELVGSLPRDQSLHLTSVYKDSLRRFAALSTMLEVMGYPFLFASLFFLVVVIGVQLATLVGHRRHSYGILLAKGLSHRNIYHILWLQVIVIAFAGFILALAIFCGIWYILYLEIYRLADSYSDVITISGFSRLPLRLKELFYVCFSGVSIVILLSTLVLYFLPVRTGGKSKSGTAPEDLFHIA